MHLITANLMAVKVFSLFAKAPGFSHNQFLRKPKLGAIPHQGESFSDQSQKEDLQIQKRNLPLNRDNQILSGKLVQINFRQDCFTNDKRTSNSFSILSKTTENNPSNSPSFEGRIWNIKSRNSILKRQRCYHGNSFNSSKVYKLTLYSPKTLRKKTTCDKRPVKENLLLRNQCYSVKFILLPLALQDLDCWIHCIFPPQFQIQLYFLLLQTFPFRQMLLTWGGEATWNP